MSGRTRLCVPHLPPEAVCDTCGNRNDSHRYRHRFQTSLTPIDPWPIVEAAKAMVDCADSNGNISWERVSDNWPALVAAVRNER